MSKQGSSPFWILLLIMTRSIGVYIPFFNQKFIIICITQTCKHPNVFLISGFIFWTLFRISLLDNNGILNLFVVISLSKALSWIFNP